MVTASHNPPQDNGYKVFWADGAQIIPPHDTGISAELDRIESTQDIALADAGNARSLGQLRGIPKGVHDRYFSAVSGLRVYDGPTDISIVYSAMHGVGRLSVEHVLRTHGYPDLHVVPEQADPDPDFPTVAFPNPEEPGAMDLSLSLAMAVSADLVFANDPDADRLCVAVPVQSGYQLLSGNEVGVLLADELLRYGPIQNDPLVVTTIVSTSMLNKVAQDHGARCVETLTGFKWLAHAGLKHEASGGTFVVGFEEAIGYSVGSVVRDKDGVSTALIFADLAARCVQNGETVQDRLDGLYRKHGLYETAQLSFKFPGESGQVVMGEMMDSLRANPPSTLDGSDVEFLRDYRSREVRNCRNNETQEMTLPSSNVLGFHMYNGSRLMVRPSGTEPKIKFYFEVCEPVVDDEDICLAKDRAQCRLRAFMDKTMSDLDLQSFQ
jgi:phosphomannomutase